MNLRAADVSRIGLERSSMRRSIALLVSATAVLLAASSAVAPAASASGARLTRAETAPAVPTDAVGIAPAEAPTLALNLDAGASEEHDVVVSNRTSNLRLTVRLAATDATGASGTGAGMWLAFGTNVVELDPHASLTIPMTIAVPHDTQPGAGARARGRDRRERGRRRRRQLAQRHRAGLVAGLRAGHRGEHRADRSCRRTARRPRIAAPVGDGAPELRSAGRGGARHGAGRGRPSADAPLHRRARWRAGIRRSRFRGGRRPSAPASTSPSKSTTTAATRRRGRRRWAVRR